ncbi:MAG TPA: hypothetical protein VGF59_22375 [Bryobacteraceae bacterium]
MKQGGSRFAGGLFPLIAALCIQALLLFYRLDLLPVWGDEAFTLQVAPRPLGEIVGMVQRDIHPPLYYFLLHWWSWLPLPWTGVAALRAFSCVAALAATVLLDRFWLARWRPAHRWPALALFAYSPCLLLYGRMARSYALQMALALAAISLLWRWMRAPREIVRRALPALAAVVALLYTHYLPGIALLAAFCLTAWRLIGWRRVAAFAAAAAVTYAPWIVTLRGALRAWGAGGGFQSTYTFTGSAVAETVLKIGAALASLTIGESFAALSLLLVPLLLALVSRGLRAHALGPSLRPILAVSAAIGYIGATRWVTWPFVAARLLWLLPFLVLAAAIGLARLSPVWRTAAVSVILASFASSMVLYYRTEDFLNLGYAAPVREIAAQLRRDVAPGDVVLVDGYNTDVQGLHYYLGRDVRLFAVRAETAPAAEDAARNARVIWAVRNTRDVSPGHLVSRVEGDSCRGRSRSSEFYEPYAWWQRRAIRLVTGAEPPEFFYQVTTCR